MPKEPAISPEDVEIDTDWGDGTPSDAAKLAVFKEWRANSDEFMANWLNLAKIAFEYAESYQVPPELRDQGPIFYWTLNLCRDIISGIQGAITGSEPVPVVTGRGFTDKTGASAIGAVFLASMDDQESLIREKNPLAARDMLTCGVGAIWEWRNKNREVFVGKGRRMFGDVACTRIDPLKLRFDGNFRQKDRNTLDYLIILEDVKLRPFRQTWGKKVEDIKGRKIDPVTYTTSSRTIDYNSGYGQGVRAVREEQAATGAGGGGSKWMRVAEVEHVLYRVSELVKVIWKEEDSPDDPNDVTSVPYVPPDLSAEQTGAPPTSGKAPGEAEGPPAVDAPSAPVSPDAKIPGYYRVDYDEDDERFEKEKDRHRVMKRLKYRVRHAQVCEDVLLKDEETDFDEIPVALYLGEEIHGFPIPVGLMYHLKSPQDLINMLISTYGDNALRTNNGGWIYESTALSPDMKTRIEEHGSEIGLNIETQPGQKDKVSRLSPGQVGDGVLRVWSEVRGLLEQISGRRDIQAGQGGPSDMSGRAVIARQQGADLSQTGFFGSVKSGLNQLGRFRLRNMQSTYTYPRMLRYNDDIAGAKTVHLQKINGKMAIVSETGETLLEDFAGAEFDLEIKVESGAPKTQEQKLDEAKFYFEAGIASKRYLAQEGGIKDYERVIKERESEDRAVQLGNMALKAIEADPDIEVAIQNPKIFDGLVKDAKEWRNMQEQQGGQPGQPAPPAEAGSPATPVATPVVPGPPVTQTGPPMAEVPV